MYQLSTADRDEIATHLDRLIRENATLKAKLQQQQTTTTTTNNSLFLELLSVIDALDYLNTYLAENPNPPPAFHQRLPHSIRAITTKLETALADKGIKSIDIPLNLPADFHFCTAVTRQPRTDIPPQSVIKVTRRGFYTGESVLRAAEIVISTEETPTTQNP